MKRLTETLLKQLLRCFILNPVEIYPIRRGSIQRNCGLNKNENDSTKQNRLRGVVLTLLFLISISVLKQVSAGDVWLADTRTMIPSSADSNADSKLNNLRVLKLNKAEDQRTNWIPATTEEFWATHVQAKPLVIIIHGNWMSSAEAQSHGVIFDRLTEKFGDFRLLVWTWDSERIFCGIRKDALLKARRADLQAVPLVHFLRQLQPESKVSLIGFSFGAKLVCATLEQLSLQNINSIQNKIDTKNEEPEQNQRLQIRTVLLAGALNRDSLLPNRQYGQALNVTEKMLIHINPDDETLCFYPLMTGLRGPQAVGKEGAILNGISPENRKKIKSVNVQSRLGSEHAWLASLRGLLANKNEFRCYGLFED